MAQTRTDMVAPAGAQAAPTPADAQLKLSNYLGILEAEPDDLQAILAMHQIVATRDPERLGEEPVRLLEMARQGHELRTEFATVARLIEVELPLVQEDKLFAASLWKELGRLRADFLLEPEAARDAYLKALEVRADDAEILEAQKRLEQAESSWKKFAKRFVEEAESATDLSLKTSLLLRAATLSWQWKKKGKGKEAEKLFHKVLELDAGNVRAALLFEHTLRDREEWSALAQHLLSSAEAVRDRQDRINFYVRGARVFARKLGEKARAAACYERVLDFDPTHAESMAYLSEHFTESEQWDHLAGLYEDALRVPQKLDVEQGILLQIGMVHYRMRKRPEDAEPYFARLRKLDATHPAMLDFYREHLTARGDVEQLLRNLLDAQRVCADPQRKVELASEAARISQATPGMTERSIEAWKVVQRLDPKNEEAARVLKELYAKSEKWNALVDVLKAQIDAALDEPDNGKPANGHAAEEKLVLLRELAGVYRDHLRLDGMLINTYNAILRVAPNDRTTLAALAEKYRELGRWNDLINVLTLDADSLTDVPSKIATYLRVAALWVEHFSNHNQAASPLEKVLELEPHNREALSRLREIYEKKRAWKQLFEVLRKEIGVASDPSARAKLTVTMAELASDRLHRYADAIALWREVAQDDAHGGAALEAMEKLSEREKDWATLADVLDKQIARESSGEGKIRVLLKLGSLYAERLEDPEGASRAWRRILDIDPRQGRALRALRDSLLSFGEWDALEALYERAADFEGLVDVLSGEADRSETREVKIDLSFRAARIFEDKVGEPQRAQRSYERVLAVDPQNARAARALAPIYEKEEKWSRLSAVLDVVLRTLDDKDDAGKLELLSKLRTLAQEKLRDGELALSYALRSYELAPGDAAVRQAFESAAELAQAFERVVETYLSRAQKAKPEEALQLHRRVAVLAADRLGRSELAAEQWRKVLALAPKDVDALSALERIYRAEGKASEVRDVLVRKLDDEQDTAARMELLAEIASLEEEKLGDADSAAARYRAMAELEPDSQDVWMALDRFAVAGKRHDELAKVLQKRWDLESERVARVELGARLGLLQLDKLDAPGDALKVLAEVLELEPGHGATLVALEKLAEDNKKLAPKVHVLLEKAYERTGRFDKVAKVIQLRLTTVREEAELRRLRLRLAEISSGKLGDALGAYVSLEAAFLEEPSDKSLWDRLAEAAIPAKQDRALASAYARAIDSESVSESDRIELAVRAAQIHDEVLNEPQEAEVFHKRVLAHDPLSDKAFVALKELYTTQERWEDLQALYRKRIDETLDGEQRLDLLLQVCFLFEEILDRPESAIEAYQAVLELAPDHAPSRRTLEKLYERTERHRDLANLLRTNLDQAEGYDQVDLLYRLGELYENKLAEPGLAVDSYEGVLQNQPHHLRAQAALARLLAAPSQRQRVAAILEPTYESQGAYTDLVRVLEIQLADRESPEGKGELLMRIGELYESRLKDAEGAFNAFSGAVEADPSERVAREALARVASARETYRRKRAQVLERAAAAATDADLQVDLLLELGQLLDEYLDDKVGAERAYERLIEVAQGRDDIVLAASRALERLHMQSGDHVRLAEDLERQAELEIDAAARERLFVRLAELYEHKLDNVDGAISARKRSLELDAENPDALASLQKLYEGAQRYPELIEILERRVQLAPSDDARRTLSRRVAHIYEEKLADTERAIQTYNDVLSTFGHDRETLAAVIRLHEAAGSHQDLLDALEQDAALAPSAGERATLRFRMAEVLRDKLGEVERSLGVYEVALEEDPEHAGTLAALDALIADVESPFRHEAARLAAPRYESLRRYDKLIVVLELLAESEDEHDKLDALRKAAAVAERGQNDPAQAMGYIGRALRAAPTHESLPELLAQYSRLAESTGRFAEYVTCLQEIAPSIFDIEQKTRVYRRVAEVAREKLSDTSLARSSLRKLLEEQSDDAAALDALVLLDEEAGDHAALIDVLKRKADLASDRSARMQLLARQADVYERGLDDAENAIGALEELVAQAPSTSAFESLERLYQRTHRWADLGTMYESQIALRVGDPVELHYRVARNSRQHLSDTHAALEHLRHAVTRDPKHTDSIALLESIMSEHGEHRAVAAEILEPGYLARMEWAKLTSALRARVDAELDLDERKRLLLRLARIHEEQLEDFDETIEVYARIFREDPRDEEIWETLTRLAKVGSQWSRLAKVLGEAFVDVAVEDPVMAKLARYVGSIYDERVVNLVKAAELYEKSLDFDRDDRESFRALESVYRRAGNHAALLELYEKQATAAPDDTQRIELLHKRAQIFSTELADRKKAGETYREIVELDPNDAIAVAGFEAVLAEQEDFAGLAEHLRGRASHSVDSADEAQQKYRLGELLWSKLNDESGAIEVFEEITQLNPSHGPTMTMLERIVLEERHTLRVTEILEPVYRHLDQWKKLIAIYEARLSLLEDQNEAVRLLAEVAELHEKRGKDLMHAFRANARAFAKEPDNDSIRGEVDRLASRTGAWDEHVAAYEAAFAASSDDSSKTQLLTTIARVHDEKRGDPRAAIEAYERLLRIEVDDPSTLDALEALHTMVGDWRGLIEVFERKVASAFVPEERADVLRRIGSVLEELLGDRESAINAYRRAITEVDSDELALEALDRLYSSGPHPAELADILRRRIENAREPADRVELGLRLGVVNEEHLHRMDDAIEAFSRVLDDDQSSHVALTRLEALYERRGLWSELLDNLRLQISLAESSEQRVQLRCKAGRVLASELGDVPEAVELYREALMEDPRCEPAISALLALTSNAEHYALAAEVIEPLLREQERWDDLAALVQRRVDSITDPADRRVELVRLAEIHEQGRRSPSDAFGTLTKALADDPSDVSVQDDLERLAGKLGVWTAVFRTFMERASSLSDTLEAAALLRRAGRVAEQELHDDSRAIEAFVRASEHDDDAPETLAALDRLYDKTQSWEPLVDVLERRIAALTAPSERAELLIRLGDVRDSHFADGRGAFVAYQEVLDNDPGDARALQGMQRLGERDDLARDVLEVLDRCFRETGAVEKVVNLYDIKVRLAATDSEKVRLLREAAALWENDLGEPQRALFSLRRAFELDPTDLALLDELERLAEASNAWQMLSGLIEKLIEQGAIESAHKREVLLRAASWYRERLGDVDGEERSLTLVLGIDPKALDVHARIVELARAKGDVPGLVRALKRNAAVEPDAEERKARLHEAAALALQTGDVDSAVESFEGVLDAGGDEVAALAALADIKAAQGRHAEAVALYTRRLGIEASAEQRIALFYRIAELQASALSDREAAVETYRALLDEAPSEERAEAELDAAYEALARYADLRTLIERKLQAATDPEARVAAHVRLAQLLETKLGDQNAAIARLRALLAESPDHAYAARELTRLLELAARFDELAELVAAQAKRALERGDQAIAVEKSWELARIFEEKLQDLDRALDTLVSLRSLVPQDRKALDEMLRLQMATERYAEAAATLHQLGSLLSGEEAISTAHSLADLATTHLADPALAESALRRALSLDPKRSQTRARLRAHFEAQAAHDKLAELLAQDVELSTSPTEQKDLLTRVAALYSEKLGDPRRASEYLERAVALAPDDRAALLALCDLYIAAQRHNDAVPVLEKIIASYGGRRAKEVATYEHRLGQAYESAGNQAEALKHYDAAFKIDLTSVPVLRDLGRLCLATGDLDRAQKTYRALLLQKLSPEVGLSKADVYYRLGEISQKQGDKPKAKAMLERAITEAGQHPAAKALLEQL